MFPFSSFSGKQVKIVVAEVGEDIFKGCLVRGLRCSTVSRSKLNKKMHRVYTIGKTTDPSSAVLWDSNEPLLHLVYWKNNNNNDNWEGTESACQNLKGKGLWKVPLFSHNYPQHSFFEIWKQNILIAQPLLSQIIAWLISCYNVIILGFSQTPRYHIVSILWDQYCTSYR